MAKSDCDVCGGRGKIRVPVYPRHTVAEFNPRDDFASTQSSREYPCPECSEIVPVEHVGAASEEVFVASYVNEPGFMEHVKNSLGHQIVDFLLRHNYVEFERSPTDERQMRFQMRATVGVVSKKRLATIQERVEQHQEALAREVMAEAKRQIDNWGSTYGHTSLHKSQARDSVDGALAAVLKARSNWRAA